MRRLLIRPGGIGDCLLCFPAMQHLRSDYLEVWTPTPIIPLVRFADKVCSIASSGLDLVGLKGLAMPSRVQATLEGFDEIVSWYGTARPEFRAALASLGPKCRFLAALPPENYGGNASDFFAQQVGAVRGLRPTVDVPDTACRDAIVIHAFSGGKKKNWPLDHFRELAGLLPSPVEWVVGPEEELQEAYRFDNLFKLARWMKGARLYIGNDSGITHLAAAIGMRVLALFGPTDPEVWAPRDATVMRSESLSSLLPSAVLEKTLKLLQSPAVSSAESVCARP